MYDLFGKVTLQSNSARKAYFVKNDNETTEAYGINRGIVNIVVGFELLKPVEFVY